MAGVADGGRRDVSGRVLRGLGRAAPWLVGAFYSSSVLDLADSAVAAWVGVALGATLGAVLVWRRERPEAVTAVVLALTLLVHVLVPEIVIPVAGMVAVGSLALVRPPAVSLVGLAGLLAVSAVNFFTTTVDDAVFTMVVAVAVWALGEAARNRRSAITEASRRAVSEEQARIARELHDVIAHSVSVIVVQAAAADDVFDTRPDQARQALRSIEGVGREALRELRRLLPTVRAGAADGAAGDVRDGVGAAGDVRDRARAGSGVTDRDGTSPPPAADDPPPPPQPGVARLEELAVPLRAAGLRVVVTSEGAPSPLPAGVDISAYRIVQEALTNTLRHARATVAEVTVRYDGDAVEIEVVDDGRAGVGLGGAPSGFGLVGMNERAVALGGSLSAGPTAHGGYRVHARLPLEVSS